MLKLAVLDDYQRVALQFGDWSVLQGRVEVRVLHQHLDDIDSLVAAIADCEIVLLMKERTPFGQGVIDRLPKLRLLVTTGVRNAALDLAAATARGIQVCGTRGNNSTHELTWGLLLGLARHVPQEAASLRAGGPWQSTLGRVLGGKRLGVLGLGHVGGKVARLGLAFDMEVQAWSANLSQQRCDEVGVQRATSLDALLASSDAVSIHLVLSERTRGLIGREQLARMKPGAFLVNTARGPIVGEAALIEALRKGALSAALDVFEHEPLPPGHPFRTLPNVLATPHLGYVTENCYRVFFEDALEDIRGWLAGTPVRQLNM